MQKLFGRRTRAMVFLATLALMANLLVFASQGKSDGVGGWPIVQCDTTSDSTLSSSAYDEPKNAEENLNLLTIVWLIIVSV